MNRSSIYLMDFFVTEPYPPLTNYFILQPINPHTSFFLGLNKLIHVFIPNSDKPKEGNTN